MKKKLLLVLFLCVLIAGCDSNSQPAEDAENVTKGKKESLSVKEQNDDITEENSYQSIDDSERYYANVPRAIDNSNDEIRMIKYEYDEKKTYKEPIRFEDLEENIQQKCFSKKYVSIERTELRDIYEKYMKTSNVQEYDSFYIDIFQKINFTNDSVLNVQIDLERIQEGTIVTKNDLYTGDVKRVLVEDVGSDEVSFVAVLAEKVAFNCSGAKRRLCIVDMKKNEYQLIDYVGLIAGEYGMCEENSEYEYFDYAMPIEFLNEDTIIFVYMESICQYSIKDERIVSCIKMKDGLNPYRGNKSYTSVSINKNIWSFIETQDNEASEFYAVDIESMSIVSHIKLDKGMNFTNGIYRDGISYFINGKGVYVYNPDEGKFETVCEQLEDDVEYKMDEIIEDDELDVDVKCIFKSDDEMYLFREVTCPDDWLERTVYKICLEDK